ncbi:MAG: hypothetical protein QOH47_2792 [Sphingomonadales bacterium]|jgi:hypothetical protein|nr:hypothetical protein [Sphingomonadales bacterium]
MLRVFIGLVLASLAAAAPAAIQERAPAPAAQGSREPTIAPAAAWVEPAAPSTPDPALADRPAQVLLADSQSLYGPDHSEHYANFAFLIQNAQGLQGLGNIILPWQPESSALIIHKVRIIRNGTIIDLLAGGQRFTVLRRENNLESAMLDGVLTAVMQPDGLAVGDILDVAWSLRRHGSTLPLRSENFFFLNGAQPVGRVSIRQIWPESVPIRWRGTGVFEHPQVRSTSRGTELSVELNAPQVAPPPAQVPARLQMPATLQLTQFRDWNEIGALLAPHYERAQQLAPDSPLRAEIERIAAASQDPRARTLAALRLVQDQVRYFALVMGDGNYLPATAEQSWTRRYADCKGKTVLLVALLRGLGIAAEPVLVNSQAGDSLGERMPSMLMFNHMIVRARIDGRSYWLDGTRSGDRILDDLASSTLGWGLPIRPGGATLEAMAYAPPTLPLLETAITYDGSAGLGSAVPMRMEQIFRGDGAVQLRLAIAQVGREAYLRQFRESITGLPNGITVSAVDFRDDPDAGSITFLYTGQATLPWNPVPGTAPAGGPRRFRFNNEVEMQIEVDRPEGPYRDAPIALPVPVYVASSETVILPAGGHGFSIDGGDFERVIAGSRFTRRAVVADGRATVRSEVRRIEREISPAAARASAAEIRLLQNDWAYLRVPASALRPAGRRP